MVPPAPEFDRLKSAVTFSRQGLDEQFGQGFVDALEPFIIECGALDEPDLTGEPVSRVSATPILAVGTTLVAIEPAALLSALRHWLIVRAAQTGVLDELARHYREVVTANVGRSMFSMGFRTKLLDLDDAPEDLSEMFCSFDLDKVAHVLIAIDPLHNYDPNIVYGSWENSRLSETLNDRIKAVKDQLRARIGIEAGILHLAVIEALGRWFVAGIRADVTDGRSYALSLESSDLALISRLSDSSAMEFWRFARAADELRDTTQVMQFSTLDEFTLYRDHGNSFYLGDERRPDLISVESNMALGLRLEDARGFDYHGVFDSSGMTTVDVMRVNERTGIPIYATDPLQPKVDFLVEGLSIPVWVCMAPVADKAYRSICFELSDMIAYWVWQASVHLEVLTEVSGGGTLVIEVGAVEDARWFENTVTGSDQQAADFFEISESAHSISINFDGATLSALGSSDNAGERVFVRALVQELLGRLHPDHQLDLDEVTDRIAPLGIKKKMVVAGEATNPTLASGKLPRARHVTLLIGTRAAGAPRSMP